MRDETEGFDAARHARSGGSRGGGGSHRRSVINIDVGGTGCSGYSAGAATIGVFILPRTGAISCPVHSGTACKRVGCASAGSVGQTLVAGAPSTFILHCHPRAAAAICSGCAIPTRSNTDTGGNSGTRLGGIICFRCTTRCRHWHCGFIFLIGF